MNIERGLPTSETAAIVREDIDKFEASKINDLKHFIDQVAQEARKGFEARLEEATNRAAKEALEAFEKYRGILKKAEMLRKTRSPKDSGTADLIERMGLESVQSGLIEIRERLNKEIKGS